MEFFDVTRSLKRLLDELGYRASCAHGAKWERAHTKMLETAVYPLFRLLPSFVP